MARRNNSSASRSRLRTRASPQAGWLERSILASANSWRNRGSSISCGSEFPKELVGSLVIAGLLPEDRGFEKILRRPCAGCLVQDSKRGVSHSKVK